MSNECICFRSGLGYPLLWHTHESTAFSLEGVTAAVEPEPSSDGTGCDPVVEVLCHETQLATRATRNYALQVGGHLLEEQRRWTRRW